MMAQEACHKPATSIAEALAARNQKIPIPKTDSQNLLAKNSPCHDNALHRFN